jgi:hypothetical protein
MPFEVVKDLIHSAARTLFRLNESPAYTFNRVHTIRHLLTRASVHRDHLGFAPHRQYERTSCSAHPFHQPSPILSLALSLMRANSPALSPC